MSDFAGLASEQLIEFINQNFDQFASARAEDFPANVLTGIELGEFTFATCKEGFAVASKGRWYGEGWGQEPANFMFLYVAPEYESRGIGSNLIAEVKGKVTQGVAIRLQCEGADRRRFFEKHGFIVSGTTIEPQTYYMRFENEVDDEFETCLRRSVALSSSYSRC
jgi:GNAT superfamily N-acetyltransferase